jgi:thymidylate kinase
VERALKYLKPGTKLVIDAYPYTMDNMRAWRKRQLDKKIKLCGTIYLNLHYKISLARCQSRARPQDKDQTMKRLDHFWGVVVYIIYRLKSRVMIDASQPLPKVCELAASMSHQLFNQ